MEVFVVAPSFRCSSFELPPGSVVRDVLERFIPHQDWYVTTNGRLSGLEERLQDGAVYRLEPRLRGGKGGFGSMLRALGAQIEKTTNREACRDLSGRRLRDVNHEKEMADWLKKQSEREAEKEQRRLERLQRKLSEPRHQFTDPQYQQQCHDLSERLEDSVLKGLQVTSSSQVKVGADPDQNRAPARKRRKTAAAAGFWTGLEELLSSEDEDDEDESPCSRGAVTMTTQRAEAEPGPSSSTATTSEVQNAGLPTEPTQVQNAGLPTEPTQVQNAGLPTEPTQVQNAGLPTEPTQVQNAGLPTEPTQVQNAGLPTEPTQVQNAGLQTEPAVGPSGDQNPPQGCREPDQLDLSSVPSVQQLESLGLEVLKEELMRRGLKCGGTLSERAARLFSVRGLSPDRIDPALLARTRRK
ncbi:replication stress response regulator SDE2 isoform X2 [Gambusia affinis]|uniref:replication stress response regulator SDE2 isoform X2 n=1 Tax=Gambusia affinis TaxID=33528 RepID=UPI001CDC6F3E|nr:replication stress response regulator SDE2 isoform X2 [Gambusia affinis]